MKKLFALLLPLFLMIVMVQPSFAGYPSSPSPKFESVKKSTTVVKESKLDKLGMKIANFVTKPFKTTGNSQVVAIILCFFLGGLGIHRVYLGGSGKLILFYLLLSFVGLGGILALIDFIALIVSGTGPFEGNDKLLACFDAF